MLTPPIQADFKVELGENTAKFPKNSYVELSAENNENSKLFIFPSQYEKDNKDGKFMTSEHRKDKKDVKFKTFKGITYTGLRDRPYHVSAFVRNPNCVAKVGPNGVDAEQGKSYVFTVSNYVPVAANKKATCDINAKEFKTTDAKK